MEKDRLTALAGGIEDGVIVHRADRAHVAACRRVSFDSTRCSRPDQYHLMAERAGPIEPMRTDIYLGNS